MNTSANNFSQRGPSRMKDPYADSLLFGNDVAISSGNTSSANFQQTSSMGLSPIKTLNSAKKTFTPSFERSFEENAGRRTVFEANMRGRKQPPLSSSIFADNHDYLPQSPVLKASIATSSAEKPSRDMKDRSFLQEYEQNHRSPRQITVQDILNPSDNAKAAGDDSMRSMHPYLSPAMDRLEAIWSSWVIVYGFDPRAIKSHDILLHFQQFGEIGRHHVGENNWILVKFESPLEAERAAGQPCFFLASHQSLLAVNRMTVQLARSLGIQIASDGSVLSLNDLQHNHSLQADDEPLLAAEPLLRKRSNIGRDGLLQSRHYQPTAAAQPNSAQLAAAESSQDIYLAPKRQKNICERIVDYFWSY